jgi:copper oxidase (laccase) domain-containing protein
MNKANLLEDILYAKSNDIACFDNLKDIKHGFTWGRNSINMSCGYAQDKGAVKNKIGNILEMLAMSSQQNAVSMSVEHGTRIVNLDGNTYKNLKEFNDIDNAGRYIECDALFTKQRNIPLICKPGDCLVSIIKALNNNGDLITGLIHTGTKGILYNLASKSVKYIKEELSCDLENIEVYICPGIFPENYFTDDINKFEGVNIEEWPKFIKLIDGKYHINLLDQLIDQYVNSGISPSRITAYKVDTYEAAKRGEGFSHVYSRLNNVPNGRFMVVVQID